MTWQKVDDQLATHSKPRRAGLEAMGLWVMCGSMAAQTLSDGIVAGWYVASWSDGDVLAKRLVDADLWHARGHSCPICPQPPEGDWVFHDWLQANPSRADVLDRRTKRSEAGQAGGQASARARAQAKRSAPAQANGSPNREAVASSIGATPSRPVPRTKSVVTLVGLLTSAGATDVTTTTINSWADKNTPHVDVEAETSRFLTTIEGQTIRDLAAAWRAWMRKARPASQQTSLLARATTVGLPPAADAPRCEVDGHEHELAGHCRICAADSIATPPNEPIDQEATP